jgi:Cu/Ag efflux pump CusA
MFASGAGAASRVSVGFVVVCGMAAATFIGIFFIPVLYVIFQSIREWAKSGFRTTPAQNTGELRP